MELLKVTYDNLKRPSPPPLVDLGIVNDGDIGVFGNSLRQSFGIPEADSIDGGTAGAGEGFHAQILSLGTHGLSIREKDTALSKYRLLIAFSERLEDSHVPDEIL